MEAGMEPEIKAAAELAEELERIALLLEQEAEAHSSVGGRERPDRGGRRGLIVWREVPGLERGAWERLSAGKGCSGWHVCDPGAHAVPSASVRSDMRREERTGLWRPLPFIERVKE